MRLDDKLNTLLRTLNDSFCENVFNFLVASWFTPAILYGFPKISKVGCPVRLILSVLRTLIIILPSSLSQCLHPLMIMRVLLDSLFSFLSKPQELTLIKFTKPVSIFTYNSLLFP